MERLDNTTKERLNNTTSERLKQTRRIGDTTIEKRLNKTEMAHPLAKGVLMDQISQTHPFFHSCLFLLAHLLRLWLDDHPLIYQVLNFMLQPQATICLMSYPLVECTMVISISIWWDWIWKRSRTKWFEVPSLG